MILLRQIANEVLAAIQERREDETSSSWALKPASRFDKMDHTDAEFVLMRGGKIAGYVEEPVESGSGHRAKLVLNGGKSFNIDWSVGSQQDAAINLKAIEKALSFNRR